MGRSSTSRQRLEARTPIARFFPHVECGEAERRSNGVDRWNDRAGVRDTEDGNFQSGWVAIDSGVEVEPHGDHVHRHYDSKPKILHQQLDAEQGNPAHVYQYDGQFFLANDAKDGFTVIDPKLLRSKSPSHAAKFFSGGGNHITLAAVGGKVAYSTWADRDGEHAGQVDIVGLGSLNGKSMTVHLPHGGLHGATANSGRVFFAPKDGIHAMKIDESLSKPPSSESIDHLSLGADPQNDKPYRTGAFANLRDWVLFVYGAGDEAKLGMVQASEAKLQLRSLGIPSGEGLALTTPETARLLDGREYAYVFHDRKGTQEGDLPTERLTLIELDPNGDKSFSDAKVAVSLDVGSSKITGHSGHHGFTALPNGRLGCISNPGDGSIWLVSLHDLQVLAKFQVGGAPTRLIAE